MSPLEIKLATALARAVKDEAARLDQLCKVTGAFNEPPNWFYDATAALDDYRWQQDQEKPKAYY